MGWQLGLVNQDIWNYSCLTLPRAAAGPWRLCSGWVDWDDLTQVWQTEGLSALAIILTIVYLPSPEGQPELL